MNILPVLKLKPTGFSPFFFCRRIESRLREILWINHVTERG